MYQRQIAKAPEVMTRDEFITETFDIGRVYEYGYDTIVGAIELADRFMLITEPRCSYHEHIKRKHQVRIHKSYTDQPTLLTTPIEQCYSKELSIVVLTLAGKSNEDDSHSISYALLFCENYYIVKMEWEIAHCFGYHIRINNFITSIGLLMGIGHENINLGSVFAELAQDVCRIPQWWKLSSATIILASLYLYRKNKLRAVTTDKTKRFHNFIQTMAAESETTISTVLDAYITSNSTKLK